MARFAAVRQQFRELARAEEYCVSAMQGWRVPFLSPLPGLVTAIGLFPRLTPWAIDLTRLPALSFVS